MTTFTDYRMAIVDEVIKRGKNHRETYEKYLSEIPKTIGESLDFDGTKEGKLITSKEILVEEYLESLEFEDVKFIQTLMYIGRDESAEEDISSEQLYKEKFNSLSWNTKEIEISVIVEKLPLDKYLENGKKIINKLG